jgi:nucleoid DNA-binding protein
MTLPYPPTAVFCTNDILALGAMKGLKEIGKKIPEEVSIAGLGIFTVKQRKARQARNPRTGAIVSVPAMKVPKFRAAKALKEAVK